MAVEPHLRGLSSWVDEKAAQVLEVGSTCALGGDAAWDALLTELGVRGMPVQERQKHIAEGPKKSRGALPIEVRWAVTAIYDRGREQVRAMDMKAETQAENDLVKKIETRLYAIVDEVTREHLQRVTPAAPTTSSIFAKAKASTPNYSAMGVKAGMNQMKCTACGAPRKTNDDAAVGPCVYCGGTLA